jgi:hypothetical protein
MLSACDTGASKVAGAFMQPCMRISLDLCTVRVDLTPTVRHMRIKHPKKPLQAAGRQQVHTHLQQRGSTSQP